jgi:hypothetical protein
MAVWYSFSTLGMLFPFWYIWTEKNLATLIPRFSGLGKLAERDEKGSFTSVDFSPSLITDKTSRSKSKTKIRRKFSILGVML